MSRLIVKILTDESKKEAPYASENFNLKSVLCGIHAFFSKHPANASDDTPFRTVKTVLNEIIKAVGGYQVLSLLQETSIPQTSFVYLLTSRLGNVPLTELNRTLHSQLVAVIEEITSARDNSEGIQVK